MIRFGADRVAEDVSLLNGPRRVALATNDAARTASDAELRTRAALQRAGVPLVRLFSPEHGLGASSADGAPVSDQIDALTGLPAVSLYGERFAPPLEALQDVDAVLFDMPDVGARFYTYLWTLTHIIDACAAARVTVIVLDRPNPLSGALATVEGPLLDLDYASFIGRHDIPIRYALTLGELALLWRYERCPSADVRVIPCEGWDREMLWPETGLPFIPTSPAIRSFESALFYPGVCLFEATNVGVARNTAYAFQAIEAPWLMADVVAKELAGVELPGIELQPQDRRLRLLPTEPSRIRPVSAALTLLQAVARIHRGQFQWTRYVTAANPSGEQHFERLLGLAGIREKIDAGALDETTTSATGWEARWSSVKLY